MKGDGPKDGFTFGIKIFAPVIVIGVFFFLGSEGMAKEILGPRPVALGQITAIWVGGGTIIPWGVIPVAAICGVEPAELVRKNVIPVTAGFIATVIVAVLIL